MNIRPLSVIAEPVTLAQAKQHLRLVNDDDSPPAHPDDDLIEALITAARQHAENFTGRSLAIANYAYRVSGFDSEIILPMPPTVGVTSVEYMDEFGDWQEVDPDVYYFDDNQNGGGLYLRDGEEWPDDLGEFVNPVRIDFQAGYSDGDSPPASTLPKPLYQAMLLIIGHLYENAEQVSTSQTFEIPMGAQSLMRPYRILLGMA